MRYMWRNRLRFVGRFMPGCLIGTLASMAMAMLRAALKGQFRLARVIAGALLDSRRLLAEGKGKKACVQP